MSTNLEIKSEFESLVSNGFAAADSRTQDSPPPVGPQYDTGPAGIIDLSPDGKQVVPKMVSGKAPSPRVYSDAETSAMADEAIIR